MPPDSHRSSHPPARAAHGHWTLQLAAALAVAFLVAGCASRPAPAAPAAPATPVPQRIPTAAAPVAETPTAAAPLTLPSSAPAPQGTTPPDLLAHVLADSDRILRLPQAELAHEITRLGEAEETAAEAPLLLATALAQTRQPVDTARALGLVQRVLAQPASQALHPLARWMESRLIQQRRMEDQLDRQTQQLRDAQRRIDQLNDRLEAVRAIERSLTTRPVAPSAPAAPSAPTAPGGASRTGTP